MTYTLSQYCKYSYSLKFLSKLSFVLALLGLIPWLEWFSVEIRYPFANFWWRGLLGSVSLLIFLVLSFIRILNKDKWYSALAILLFPFAIIMAGLMTLISIIPTPEWYDVSFYQHRNRHLIVERNDGWAFTNVRYRYAITCPLSKNFRLIKRSEPLDHNPENLACEIIQFEGLLWKKVDIKVH